MKEKFNKKDIIIAVLALLLVIGTSYALFSEVLVGTKNYTVNSRGLRLVLDESNTSESIALTDAIPTKDEVGVNNQKYKFSLINNDSEKLSYIIYFVENDVANKTPASKIRYYYKRDNGNVEIIRGMNEKQDAAGRNYLERGVINGNTTYNYEFCMWIDYEAGNEIMNTSYSVHLEVESTQTILYTEAILNGTDPVLTDNLVPVNIANDGTVTKADVEKEWYKYEQQRWANAVVLLDNSVNYRAGDTISEDNIESYFVWIPRYKYKIFNLGSYDGLSSLDNKAVKEIEIEFETKDYPISTGGIDSWYSHPAFQAFDSNGFWVGKFETGYQGSDPGNVADSTKVAIKPNITSWRSITVGNEFKTSYDYLREDESHMMKNTEWGAVAYLHHSKYGSMQSLRTNNNNAYITGYAAVNEPTCGYNGGTSIDCNQNGTSASVTLPYNTETGYLASTTANITGVYDMAGGAWEYVMGYTTAANTVGGSSGITTLYSDFFTNKEWEKYYDKYSSTTYSGRILGDATGEMGPFANITDPDNSSRPRTSWYGDYAWYVNASGPWFIRGCSWHYGVEAGAFAFYDHTGGTYGGISFRVVLTPKGGV